MGRDIVLVNKNYVLKIANAIEKREMLDAQNQAMGHVLEWGLLPKVVNSLRGEQVESVSINEIDHFVRLVTYIDGTPLGNVKRHSPELIFDLGRELGEFDRALQDFDHSALHRDLYFEYTEENLSKNEGGGMSMPIITWLTLGIAIRVW